MHLPLSACGTCGPSSLLLCHSASHAVWRSMVQLIAFPRNRFIPNFSLRKRKHQSVIHHTLTSMVASLKAWAGGVHHPWLCLVLGAPVAHLAGGGYRRIRDAKFL
jgi:hypothetical protein